MHASVVVTAWVSDGIDDPSTIALLISALCEVLIDLVNTIALYTGLRKLKTGWKRTDALLSNLIHLTIETQLPPLLVYVLLLLVSLLPCSHLTHKELWHSPSATSSPLAVSRTILSFYRKCTSSACCSLSIAA